MGPFNYYNGTFKGGGTVSHNDDYTYAVRKLVNRGPGDKMCSKRLGDGICFWNLC